MTTLPRSCVPCEKIEEDGYDWYDRHRRKLEEVKTKQADIVFIGDSITHFWNNEDGDGNGLDVWEEFYGKRSVLNLGYGFDRTQNMLWRIHNGEMENQTPEMIVINAGTNQFSITQKYDGDSSEIAFEGVKLLIEEMRKLCPAARIVVMAVFPRLPEETTQKRIDGLNALLKIYVEEQQKAGDNILFLDITKQMRHLDGSFNPDLYIDQRCHPNSAGYRIWAEALEVEIRKIMP
ncbi:MAG: G-D-S-L family lipolytic protein [Lentisphaerae bacterium]|nr:G-D-S-L family lipolytic protein [Lentisphaerota bacterium]